MKDLDKSFLHYLPKVMDAQKYLSPTAFAMLIRILHLNLNGVEFISGVDFQNSCNIGKNTVSKTVEELQQASCIVVKRYPRSASKYHINLEGCKSYINTEKNKEDDEQTEISRSERNPISAGLKKLIFERDLYRCINCGTHKSLSIDHTVPVSRGGGNEIKNLQTLCTSCNSSKGNKTMSEWLDSE